MNRTAPDAPRCLRRSAGLIHQGRPTHRLRSLLGALLLSACGGPPDEPAGLDLVGCVAEPLAERVGRPNQAVALRLLNGWRWAGRGALAAATNPVQSVRVPARRHEREIVLRTADPLSEPPQASLDGTALALAHEGDVVRIRVPGSRTLRVGHMLLELPAGTVLVDSRVRRLVGGEDSAAASAGEDSSEWSRCAIERIGTGSRLGLPAGSVAEGTRAFIDQDDRWQELEPSAGSSLNVPAWVDPQRAVLVLESPAPVDWTDPRPPTIEGDAPSIEGQEPTVDVPDAVLVFVMDALRARTAERVEALESYGGWKRLVVEGTSLRNHFAVAPNTLPSTKALFTGRIWPQRGGWKLRPEEGETMAEAYHRAGYRTAMFSNNPYVSAEFGVDRGFDFVHGEEVELEERNEDARILVDAALTWLDRMASETEDDAPIFLYVHVLQPHNPYRPGAEALDLIGASGALSEIDGRTATLLEISRGQLVPTPGEVGDLRSLYAAQMIEAVEQMNRLRARLALLRAPERTVIVATSDHGEEILEHDSALHGYTLYDEMIRIPALVIAPGRAQPARSLEGLSDTTDMHCWLRSLVAPGSSCGLTAALSGEAELPGAAIISAAASVKGGIFAIRSNRIKLVVAPQRGSRWGYGSGRGRTWEVESLFDLVQDPSERVNLLSTARGTRGAGATAVESSVSARLRLDLDLWLERQRRWMAGDEADEEAVDAATERRLESLGYVQ